MQRQRGGIEPLRVSTPHDLKSCPCTSPTHPGPPAKNRPASAQARARPLMVSSPCAQSKAHVDGGAVALPEKIHWVCCSVCQLRGGACAEAA